MLIILFFFFPPFSMSMINKWLLYQYISPIFARTLIFFAIMFVHVVIFRPYGFYFFGSLDSANRTSPLSSTGNFFIKSFWELWRHFDVGYGKDGSRLAEVNGSKVFQFRRKNKILSFTNKISNLNNIYIFRSEPRTANGQNHKNKILNQGLEFESKIFIRTQKLIKN